MRILILTTHLNKGGVPRYVLNLAKGLKMRANNVYVASCGGEWVSKLEEEGIAHKYIPIGTKSICSPKIFLSICKLLPFLRANKIQIIHCNSRVTQCLGFFLSKLCKIPYISAFHGYYRPTCFRKLFRLAGTRTIAVSKAVKRHLIEDLKIDADRVEVVYNGIDKNEFSQRNKNKTDAGFNKDVFLIGILGRISQEKGHFLAVEALKSLLPKHKNCYLLISGRGKMEQDLRAFITKNKVEDKVKFIYWKAEDFLDILDLLIMPSKKEGFGYAIIEAFAKAVAVVGFNVGGISEIIKDKENGILFYNYDATSLEKAISEVITDLTLREKIVTGGRKSIS
ncbi:MAG: glycosyltransferase family 4 protein, partial [Candidatus Omnitrophota bacterium]